MIIPLVIVVLVSIILTLFWQSVTALAVYLRGGLLLAVLRFWRGVFSILLGGLFTGFFGPVMYNAAIQRCTPVHL